MQWERAPDVSKPTRRLLKIATSVSNARDEHILDYSKFHTRISSKPAFLSCAYKYLGTPYTLILISNFQSSSCQNIIYVFQLAFTHTTESKKPQIWNKYKYDEQMMLLVQNNFPKAHRKLLVNHKIQRKVQCATVMSQIFMSIHKAYSWKAKLDKHHSAKSVLTQWAPTSLRCFVNVWLPLRDAYSAASEPHWCLSTKKKCF